jgi:putative flippase GtrA
MADRMSHLWTLARSSVSSLIVIAVEVGLIQLADSFGVPVYVSFAAVQIVGTTITFVMNKLWVFGAAKTGAVVKEGAKAILVFGGSLMLNTVMPSIGSYVLGIPHIPSFLAAQAIVFLCWNYPLNRWWVFPAREARAAKG